MWISYQDKKKKKKQRNWENLNCLLNKKDEIAENCSHAALQRRINFEGKNKNHWRRHLSVYHLVPGFNGLQENMKHPYVWKKLKYWKKIKAMSKSKKVNEFNYISEDTK